MSDWKDMVCMHKGCSRITAYKWTVQGINQYGPTIQEAAYCEQHSKSFAEPSDNHSNKTEVNHE